jgi:hypothetical protein
MREMASVAAQSFVEEKTRHGINFVATGTAATAGATSSLLTDVLGWLPHVAVAAGLAVSCVLFVKTYKEIKLLNIKLAKEGRREADK